MKTLYISYFGALKPLSHSQVIPYLQGLALHGIAVTLLSFEEALDDPGEDKRKREALRLALLRSGIQWVPLRYHKKPSLPATAYDLAVGMLVATYLVLRHRIDVIHARNHVPAVIGLAIQYLFGRKLVFDMRGVMAEEYVEAGLWKKDSIPFRAVKWVEARVLGRADAIVMLTRRIRNALVDASAELRTNRAPIEIIPCCVDMTRYRGIDRAATRGRLGFSDEPIMAYAGSLGGWYMSSEMIDFFLVAQEVLPRLHLLVLTQSAFQLVHSELAARGVSPRRYTVRTVDHSNMPEQLTAADFGISFVRPGFSKWSSSPTKISEYLASGLPVVTSAGIGDIDDLMQSEGVGVVVNAFTTLDYRQAAERLAALLQLGDSTRALCRRAAEERLSLEQVGWPGYLRVYRSLEGRVP